MGRRRRGKSRFWRNVKRVARNVGKAITPPPPKPSNDLITKNTRMAYLLVELKKKHMRIKKNIVNMNNQISDYNKKIRELEKEISDHRNNLNYHKNRYNAAKDKLRQYNTEIKQLQEDKRLLDEEIAQLTVDIAKLEIVVERLNQGNEVLESEFNDLLEKYNNEIKGLSLAYTERVFDNIETQNDHLKREHQYLKNNLTRADQESTFIQPKMDNWLLANHFLRVAYYVFALVLILFLYKHFTMKRINMTLLILLLIGLYPFYILHIERFLYNNIAYMGRLLTAKPVK
jgi:prefoldin subunit 5